MSPLKQAGVNEPLPTWLEGKSSAVFEAPNMPESTAIIPYPHG